jgi:hypothetical protein
MWSEKIMNKLPDYNQVCDKVEFEDWLISQGYATATSRDGGMYGNLNYVVFHMDSGVFFELGAYQSSGFSSNFTARCSLMQSIEPEEYFRKYGDRDPRLPYTGTTIIATRYEVEPSLSKKNYLIITGTARTPHHFRKAVQAFINQPGVVDFETSCGWSGTLPVGLPESQITRHDLGVI